MVAVVVVAAVVVPVVRLALLGAGSWRHPVRHRSEVGCGAYRDSCRGPVQRQDLLLSVYCLQTRLQGPLFGRHLHTSTLREAFSNPPFTRILHATKCIQPDTHPGHIPTIFAVDVLQVAQRVPLATPKPPRVMHKHRVVVEVVSTYEHKMSRAFRPKPEHMRKSTARHCICKRRGFFLDETHPPNFGPTRTTQTTRTPWCLILWGTFLKGQIEGKALVRIGSPQK